MKYSILVAFNETQPDGVGDDYDSISEAAVQDEAQAVYQALLADGHRAEYFPVSNIYTDLQKIRELHPDIIFNLCEGYRGNAHLEMNIASLWEIMEIPFTGNSALTLGLAQNKQLSKDLFHVKGIPTPPYRIYSHIPDECDLDYPLIAKPVAEDGSVGITQKSIIDTPADLPSVIGALLQKYQQPILIERFISGREFNVSILGNQPPQVLAIGEIDYRHVTDQYCKITSYEAKWLEQHPLYRQTPAICPAEIDRDLHTKLSRLALDVYDCLGGRDYGRVDIRMNESNQLFVLEYNPNPDISPDAGFVKALQAAGWSYRHFVEFIIRETLNRKKNA
jgi:D-alanine-D-alanine ligase